nr:hypothetical protein [Tanacetum cinerariifolium]
MSLLNDNSGSTTHANMDLKRERVLGTRSESDGMYMFDVNCDKFVVSNQSKFLVCYVSKEVWHNRLGHLANQVKQTRDSFLLSDHKSVCLGELVHLDVWGPYKVVAEKDLVFPYKMSNNTESIESSENEVSSLNLFDNFKSEMVAKAHSSNPNDDEKEPSGRDGNVHQLVINSDNQPGHGDQHITNPIGEENLSKVNVGTHLDVPSFENISQNQTEEACPSVKRYNKHSKMPDRLNEFVLDDKVKYGLHSYADHSLLSSDNYCFVSNLNKSIESSSFEEASKDINWINAMNEEMHALYENDTWVLFDLSVCRIPIGSKWVFRIKYKSNE